MKTSRTCKRCGTVVPAGAPQNLCPRCLFDTAVDSDVQPFSADIPVDSTRSRQPGTMEATFGDYELLGELGRGGQGVVYRARHRSLGRIVALKTIPPAHLAGTSAVERFRLEASAASRLDHPNIVPVYEAGERDGFCFYTMKLVEGATIQQLVPEGPPDGSACRHAATVLIKAAQAVHHAHQRGVLHRDLKPSNILLDLEHEPHVSDFGLARCEDEGSSLTLSHALIGSPAYLAPEVAAGGSRQATVAADIYGLGAILYQLLAGRPPFGGATIVETLRSLQDDEAARPGALNPAVSVDLETICLKCLQKEPSRRYVTAQELADDLKHFLQGEPILARPVAPAARLWRWCCRKPAIATLGAMVLVLVLVVLLGAPVAIFRIDRARLDAERSRVEADRARVETERNLYAADMQLASESLRHGAIEQVRELLNHHYPGKGREDQRGFEWRYLAQAAADQTGLVTHQFQGLKSRSMSETPRLVIAGSTLYDTPYGKDDNFEVDPRPILAWDLKTWAPISLALPLETNSDLWWYPDTEAALAVNARDHTVTVYRLPHLEKGPSISLPGKAIQANVSKDFHTLAVAFEEGDLRHVLVSDLSLNARPSIFGEFRGRLSRMDFSPDSTVLMVEWDNQEIALWSVTGDKALPSPARDPLPDSTAAPFFAPHSTHLFTSRGDSRDLQMWDWSSGQLSNVYHAPLTGLWAPSFSPDGTLLATSWGGEVVALTDTKDFKLIGTLRGHAGHIQSVAFSPSGRFVATASRDHTAKLWDAKTQNELAILGGNEQQLASVVFTPDEKSVLTLGIEGEIKVWNLPALLQRDVLLTTSKAVADLALSADERMLATSDDHAVRLWDVTRGVELRSFPTDEVTPSKVSFSPKEPLLAWLGEHSLALFNYQSGQTNILPVEAPWDWRCAVFSPDGRELAFGGDRKIIFCDVATLKLRSFATCDEKVMALIFSPEGSLLASGHNGGGLSLWNRVSGNNITKIPATLGHSPFVLGVDFSPDGQLLASAGGDPTCKIWEVTPNGLRLRRTLRGDVAISGRLLFFPDGRRAVSYGNDHSLKVWDTETGLEVGTLYGHPGVVGPMVLSRDGNTIFYSSGDDGRVRTWQAPPIERFPVPSEFQK